MHYVIYTVYILSTSSCLVMVVRNQSGVLTQGETEGMKTRAICIGSVWLASVPKPSVSRAA
jgi:hypothetical protein